MTADNHTSATTPAGPAPVTDGDTPSRRAGLRDQLRRAVCEAEGFAWDSDILEPDEYGDHADTVLAVLYREWPWLRAEAEDAAVLPAPDRQAAMDAVRALHQPMQRGPFTICAHCSGWDGEWRCLGVVTDYPCPTVRALDGEPAREAQQDPAQDGEAQHTGGNAEDCPLCRPQIDKTVLYPWICTATAAVAQPGQPDTDSEAQS